MKERKDAAMLPSSTKLQPRSPVGLSLFFSSIPDSRCGRCLLSVHPPSPHSAESVCRDPFSETLAPKGGAAKRPVAYTRRSMARCGNPSWESLSWFLTAGSNGPPENAALQPESRVNSNKLFVESTYEPGKGGRHAGSRSFTVASYLTAIYEGATH